MTEKDIAIKVENVKKTFHIPHENISRLRGAFLNFFGRMAMKKKEFSGSLAETEAS